MDALNKWKRECNRAEAMVREHYAGVTLLEEIIKQSTSYLVYYSYRGIEYFKIFAPMKTMREDELIVEEAKSLQFVGLEKFDELLDNKKKWVMLDS